MHDPTRTPPRIASNTPRDEHVTEVEYVLSDGRRAKVAVPHHRWRDGGHTPVGPAVARMLHGLDLQRHRAASRLPD